MSPASWALYFAATLAAAGFVLWLYLRREPRGQGRLLLAGLRLAAFALLLLLLFDPQLPRARRPGPERTRVLLDASASMNLPERPGQERTRWQVALQQARRRGGTPLLFGDAVRPVPSDSLGEGAPGDLRSLLLPALQAAAESGAERVVVITDGALEDAPVLGGWLARLGLGVEWVRIGQPTPSLAIARVDAPEWARAGEPLPLEVTLVATADVPDSVRLVVRQDGRAIGEAQLPAPPAGRSSTGQVTIRPTGPAEGGFARLELTLEPGDAVPADDRRLLSIFVAADPAGVAVVSLQPDWEPRFLLPVLDRALGIPVRGYLRTGAGGWVRVAGGAEAGQRIAEGDVARSVAGADLVVIQGAAPGAPAWVLEALRNAPRLMVLPGVASMNGLPLPLELGQPVSADWFVAAQVPPSPVAALLADLNTTAAPPLSALRLAVAPPSAWAPLLATRGRGGEATPLLLVGEADGRRWAVALGAGYWRWAFRGEEPRQLYDRLWSAVAGWLLRDRAGPGGGVRPARRVSARGERPAWLTPGLPADSIALSLTDESGSSRDTVLRGQPGDTLRSAPLEPGAYRYSATAWGGGRSAQGDGELLVESYTPELSRPVVELDAIAAARSVGDVAGRAPARPLHTLPWPYVLLVLLLSAEWILRRRWGLR